MLPFAEDLDGDRIHVRAPSAVVFLCGGPTSKLSEKIPLSVRDAFLKIIDNPALEKCDIIQSEDVTRRYEFSRHYQDLLKFEVELAQVTELILLFCESEGSLAELGSFVWFDEIARRLLVVVRDRHWADDSFVKLGPLRFLQLAHGEDTVYVLDDNDIGISSGSPAGIDLKVLRDRLQDPITRRLDRPREPTTFDSKRAGHIIKLIVGLVQEYGGLTLREIDELLLNLGVYVPTEQIPSFLLLAEVLNWVVPKRKGDRDYYFARNLPDAATLRRKKTEDDGVGDKARRRIIIRDHWRKNDNLRYVGILEAHSGAQ